MNQQPSAPLQYQTESLCGHPITITGTGDGGGGGGCGTPVSEDTGGFTPTVILEDADAEYGLLQKDVDEAPIVKAGAYDFRVFSAGERGTDLSPEFMKEVVLGLVSEIIGLTLQGCVFDTIVSIHVTGAMWAFPVAMYLSKPLKLFTTEPNGKPEQRSFQQKRPYLPRMVYTPDLSSAGRCLIIDDVLNRGGTVTQMKTEIEKDGGSVVGVLCVVDKLGTAEVLKEKFGVPVVSLVRCKTNV